MDREEQMLHTDEVYQQFKKMKRPAASKKTKAKGKGKAKVKVSPKKRAKAKAKVNTSTKAKAKSKAKTKEDPQDAPNTSATKSKNRKSEASSPKKKARRASGGEKRTFARRYEPKRTASQLWWKALSTAFVEHIQNNVARPSAQEDQVSLSFLPFIPSFV